MNNLKTFLVNLFAANNSEVSPVLAKAIEATNSVKEKVAATQAELELTQADIREELKQQETIRQASAAFKGSVKDLKKARTNLEVARTKAVAAVDKTAALAEQLADELFSWESAGDDYVPTETPEEITTPAPTPAPAADGGDFDGDQPTPAPAAPVAADGWDGTDLSQLTPEQLKLLQY